MRKTAILTSVAGLFLLTAPAAFAQDPAPQTPPADPAASQSQTVSLQPGATVKGSDGSTLGTLEGAQNGASGQEITVRGSDGQLRGVPVAGLTQNGSDVVVAWSSSQFTAAPAIGGDASAPATETPTPSEGPPPAPANDPTATPEPVEPASPPATETPPAPTTPQA